METPDYTLCIVRSKMTLDDIKNHYIEAYEPESVKAMRLIYKKEVTKKDSGEDVYVFSETNRALFLIKTSTFLKLKERYGTETQYDFCISEFVVSDKNKPKKNYVYAFFTTFPEQLSPIEAERQLHEKMSMMVEAGLISSNQYRIHFIASSRESNEGSYTRHVIITFTHNYVKENCVRIRDILDMTLWNLPNNEKSFLHLAWCRKASINYLNKIHSSATKKQSKENTQSTSSTLVGVNC